MSAICLLASRIAKKGSKKLATISLKMMIIRFTSYVVGNVRLRFSE